MVTRRFDVFRNPSLTTAKHVPFLLVVQSELLAELPSRVVAPLARASAIKGPRAETLNPDFEIDSVRVVMLTQQLAAVPTALLRKQVANLESQRDTILHALDFLFSGI
jgi:toxin CcdB